MNVGARASKLRRSAVTKPPLHVPLADVQRLASHPPIHQGQGLWRPTFSRSDRKGRACHTQADQGAPERQVG